MIFFSSFEKCGYEWFQFHDYLRGWNQHFLKKFLRIYSEPLRSKKFQKNEFSLWGKLYDFFRICTFSLANSRMMSFRKFFKFFDVGTSFSHKKCLYPTAKIADGRGGKFPNLTPKTRGHDANICHVVIFLIRKILKDFSRRSTFISYFLLTCQIWNRGKYIWWWNLPPM